VHQRRDLRAKQREKNEGERLREKGSRECERKRESEIKREIARAETNQFKRKAKQKISEVESYAQKKTDTQS
jgi:hypothetical protein